MIRTTTIALLLLLAPHGFGGLCFLAAAIAVWAKGVET